MSLQRRQWYENFIKVDKQLDESKLLLESIKGSVQWWVEQITDHVNNANPPMSPPPTEAQILAWAQAMMAFYQGMLDMGYGDNHLLLLRMRKYLEKLTGRGVTIDDILPWIIPTLTNPNDVKPPPNPYVPPTVTPYQPPYPTNAPRPQH